MKMRITNFLVALLLFSVTLSTRAQIPQVSAEGNDIWYYIQCSPRNSALPNAKWLTGAPDAGEVSVAEFTQTDAQRWKVVSHGAGYALVNKANGTYMNTDQVWSGAVATSLLYASAALPATPVKFVPSLLLTNGVNIVDVNTTVAANNTIDPATMKFSFYSAGSSIFKPISYNGINIHSSVKFMQDKDFLREAIELVSTTLDNSSEGNNPGQFNSESITGMRDALEAAQAIYDDPATTVAEYHTQAAELLLIFEDFKSQVILPELSTSTVENWYFIQGTRPANTYMTSLGAGGKVRDAALIPDDTQLWKLIGNPNGGFSLQNKATGEYINTDVATGTEFVTQSNMPQNGLRFITSTITTNKAIRFWIENEVGSTPALRFHAGGSGNSWNAMNWTGNKDDNCTWLFMSYTEALRANFVTVRDAARAELNAAAKGSIIGQYNEEVYNAYKAVIETAEAMVVDDMTEQECLDAVEMLKTAKEAFVCNTDIATLQSPTPAATDYWFRLVNAATADYAKNKAMSSNGRDVNQKYTFENVVEGSDAQLFRFELNEYGASVKAIVNKAGERFVGADGMILTEPTAGVEFAVEALDGFSFKIVPTGYAPLHAQQNGSHIVNWNSGAGSASAWRIVFVKEESNIVHLAAPRTVTVASSDPTKGTAVITGTSNVIVNTDVKKVSVTATANKGIFFTGWTNAAGDTVSKANPYIYTGESNIELTANFVDGYYKAMTRFYSAASPKVQQEERYLESAYAIVGESTQTIFENVTVNPNPIAESVTPGQVIGDALLDYTSTKIEIPAGTTSFDFKAVGRNTDATVEDLQWTQQIAFIDWNQDFDFVDAGEISSKNAETAYDTTLVDPKGYTRTIQIPAQLPEGYYRMRVVYHEPVSGGDNWGVSIWTTGKIRNGVAYDFEIKYGSPNAVENTYVPQLKVRVVNSVIVVDGIESFELYNITGQKLQTNRPVRTGVYLVKSGDKVQKVFVR